MRYLFAKFADFVRESDKIMLSLLFLAAGYGCIAVYSATNYMENLRPFLIHTACLIAGFGVIIVVSIFDYARYIKVWLACEATIEFIITLKSPPVGFFIPTGISKPLAVRRCC